MEPSTTLTPPSSAAEAPAKESSEMPCTANGRSRIITNVLINPHNTPRTTPATREFCTSGSNAE
jgi:hypothetical protein